MTNQKRKSLDEFSDESESFERRFEELVAGRYSEAECAKLVEEVSGWMQECAQQGRYIPLASAERRAFKSLLERWRSLLRGKGYYVEVADSLAEFDPHAGLVLVGDCPYPGLEPYSGNQGAGFFGREALVTECLGHLEATGNRILLIVGASGSGKSSLVMAGVLPRLFELHGSSWLFAARVTPGAHPLRELASAVAGAIGEPGQASEIERAFADRPGDALKTLATLCHDKPLVLFIDQFEELLTMCRDLGEQGAMAQLLCAVSDPAPAASGFSVRTLLTIRTDHLARFENNDSLRRLHMRLVGENNERHLSAIGFEDIKRAIKAPADEVGLRFIPAALIDQMASETAGLSNGLPLLQFALHRLWNTRPRDDSGQPLDLITAEMVQSLPDVERALGTVADGIFRTFSQAQQRIAERLLLELVLLDENFEEPLRRRRNEAELEKVLEERFKCSDDVALVIDAFVGGGLLRRFGERPDSQLEVAHEALLRHWDHIYRLLTGAEVKERLHLVKQIGREAAEWTSHEKVDDYLTLRGERLARAIAYADDGWLAEAEARSYVEACRAQDEQEKLRETQAREEKERADAAERAREEAEFQAMRARRNMWKISAVAVLILACVLGWMGYRANRESTARRWAMAAVDELNRNPQSSLLLSLEAAKIGKKLNGDLLPEVESALRASVRVSRIRGVFRSYLPDVSFHSVAYTPDGSVLAVGDSMGGVTLWDVATGLQRKAMFAHVDNVKAIAFSANGRKMATGSADGRVVIWDTASGTPLRTLKGHIGEVTSLAFSRPDGRLLATAGSDASLRIWNVETGTAARAPLYGHVGGVRTVAFGRDERQVATAGDDDLVVMWDVSKGRVLYSFPSYNLFDINFSGDGSLLAVAANNNIEIWDTAARRRRWTLKGHTNSVVRATFGRDQRLLASAGYDSTIRVWRLPIQDKDPQRQPEELTQIRIEPSTDPAATFINAFALSPTGNSVATAFIGGTVTITDVVAGGELLTLPGYDTPVTSLAFNSNGTAIMASGGDNAELLEWDLSGKRLSNRFNGIPSSARRIAFGKGGKSAIGSSEDVIVAVPGKADPVRLKGHTGPVSDLAFSPDGSRLVSGSLDGTAILWELSAGNRPRVFKVGDSVTLVAYSPDGRVIATGCKKGRIFLWDATTLQCKAEKGMEHFLETRSLAFTPDGKRLVSGSMDRTVCVWDVATGTLLTVLGAHTDVVNAVAVYGDHLATGADDSIRLWDLRTLKPVSEFPARTLGARALAFSPDGRYLVAGDRKGVIRLYIMKDDELINLANTRVHRGWTPEECRLFLNRTKAPRTSFSTLDEAYQKLQGFQFKEWERLLRQALEGSSADARAIAAEVNSRKGSAFVWVAGDVSDTPERWKQVVAGRDPQQVVDNLLSMAKEQLRDQAFDASSRRREWVAYRHVKRARELLAAGNVGEAAAAFEKGRAEGWEIFSHPEELAGRLFTVQRSVDILKRLQNNELTAADARNLAPDAESALKRFPEYGPGCRVAAMLYERQRDYVKAKRLYVHAAATESSVDPLISLASLSMGQYAETRDPSFATEVVRYAKNALDRDPASDAAFYLLGLAEYSLNNKGKAVDALDRVSPDSSYYAAALNFAASIYFEDFGDEYAAYQRVTRAHQVAPDDLEVLSNYAEFLFASGRYEQAKVAAANAREHPDSRPYIKAAMTFVLLASEFMTGEYGTAAIELERLRKEVAASAADAKAAPANGEPLEGWQYKGTKRSLQRRLAASQRRALMPVLVFVESNGRTGTLEEMRHILTQPQKT